MGLRSLYVDEPFRWPLSDMQQKFEKQVNWCTYILSSLLVMDTQGLDRHPKSSGIEPTVYITTLCQGQASKNLGHHHQQKIFHMVLNSWQLSIMHEAQCYLLCSPLTCPTFATSESYTSWIATEAAFPELPLSTWVSLQFCAVNELCVYFSITSKIFHYFKSWGNITNTFCEDGKHPHRWSFYIIRWNSDYSNLSF